jgi:hypothetical protein
MTVSGGEAVADRIAAGALLTFFCNRTSAFASVAALSLDLPERSHGALSRCIEKTSIDARCLGYDQRIKRLNGYLKLEPERSHHFQHGGEFRITLGRQRLVEALPTKARSPRDL